MDPVPLIPETDISVIFQVAIPASPCYQAFDYLPPHDTPLDNVQPGIRLEVPFGTGDSKKIAFLLAIVKHTDCPLSKLKRVTRLIDDEPLLKEKDMQLLHWLSQYYHYPLGEVMSSAFPVSLRQGKAALLPVKKKSVMNKTEVPVVSVEQELQCNLSQQQAINAVCASLGQFNVFLLEGVTGSGKTEVYMQIIRTVLERGQQILVLVPEINLTPQLEARFRKRFAVSIAVSHSGLTNRQRHMVWMDVQQGHSAILLGTRSALFTPLKNPGLIILDEEHDSSFKQQEGFRFSARDVAIVKAKLLDVPVLLGTATPSLESLQNINRGRFQWLHLPERAGFAVAPEVQIVDIRNKKMLEGLSSSLIEQIKITLARNEQVLLFLNRRGFAPTLICHTCSWVARCLQCDANLVIHARQNRLRCHHCFSEQPLINQCPACNTPALTPLGLGTERVEQVLASVFPDKTIVRLDLDSTRRKGALEGFLDKINSGEADIILGTQMLAKGHHFPNVTLVAILDVDSGLFSVDFHASEKLAQLIIQVSGRAGRAEKKGRVLLQTRQPDHPLLTTLINQGYRDFATSALAERYAASLPPFSFQALLRAQATDSNKTELFFEAVLGLIKRQNLTETRVLGPIPAPMLKKAGFYRYQLLFQNNNRLELQKFLAVLIPEMVKLKQTAKVRWSLDVDPVDLY
jgi:primosomal protein N' (replication factor Y)